MLRFVQSITVTSVLRLRTLVMANFSSPSLIERSVALVTLFGLGVALTLRSESCCDPDPAGRKTHLVRDTYWSY